VHPDKTSLAGKIAMVTGAGVGMGAATARLLAARGAKVVVSDINDATAQKTCADIRAEGGIADVLVCDVSREDQVEALVAQSVSLFGRLDCAVNNAGILLETRPIADADMAVFDKIIAVNLRSVMLCMKHQIRQFLAQGSPGSIVNIGSVTSIRPQPNSAGYVASKHGVVGLTKAGSLEYAARGIRVNAVLPGAIDTPMLRAAMEPSGLTEAQVAPALSLFGRFGQADEVAEASAWLCSEASSYVTGHSLAVEGGFLTR
jgi:glucose 1-dehydrogenase